MMWRNHDEREHRRGVEYVTGKQEHWSPLERTKDGAKDGWGDNTGASKITFLAMREPRAIHATLIPKVSKIREGRVNI